MNKNHFCVFDFETGGGENPSKCQITQLSAVIINPRSLRAEPGGIFDSEVQPIFDNDKAIAADLNPVQQEALDVTRKTKEKLMEAPPEKIVWEKFKQFIKRFNIKNSSFSKLQYKIEIWLNYLQYVKLQASSSKRNPNYVHERQDND